MDGECSGIICKDRRVTIGMNFEIEKAPWDAWEVGNRNQGDQNLDGI